jgi:hypothetical protein
MKQTAIEWYTEKTFNQIELLKRGYVNQEEFLGGMLKLRDQAKEMEKEQIKNRAVESYHSFTQYLDRLPKIGGASVEMDFEQYYNETFNTKEK